MEDSKRFNSQSIPNGSHGEAGDDRIISGSFEACKNNSASTKTHPLTSRLMEQVCHRDNLNLAYKRVKSNKGAAGIDQMSVVELSSWIRRNKEALICSLLDGSYQPQLVRGVKIPKPGGKGKRQLGIPTVVDRLVQQAILQVLGPILERGFSESSFGFRPGRSAHDALIQASKYVSQGRVFVVDLDLEKFFDSNGDNTVDAWPRVVDKTGKDIFPSVTGKLKDVKPAEGFTVTLETKGVLILTSLEGGNPVSMAK